LQVVRPPGLGSGAARAGGFVLATRRGKQFNSMVQRERDGLTGAERDHVFMHPDDARALGLAADQPIVLRNELGAYRGRVFLAEVARGTLQGHWPEVNGLLAHGRVDPEGGVPDYNALVRVEAAR
jgi:anaerobic selenocysteine-containing dehydrogenase